jgi:two-component system chemotaxis sensor kinase CheA
VIEGEGTEMDKSILDKLTEPLTHLLRNSMDHGLEPPHLREQAGKPRQGTICLRARHEPGAVLIEVEDNGRGLNRERILQKARDMGMAPANMTPEHPDVPELIFLPGFSTSEEVSSVSGRGVGMDAVKMTVESLRGRISVRTQDGQGACFTLRLPTHMALIHGFYVRVNHLHLVIPMEQVLFCDEVASPLEPPVFGHINHQRQYLPYVNVGRCLGLGVKEQPRMMVVVRYGNGVVGLLVHAFLGERQTVVKPMGHMFHDHPFFNGATIQGDNSLAIVLNTSSLVEDVLKEQRQEQAA